MKNQKWLIATITVLSVIFTAGMLKTSASAATVQTQDVYRLYNYNTGEHFYTVNNAEKTNLQNAGWSYEGIGWVGATTGTPVYRVYNPNAKGGDHYYTMSKYEAQSLVNKGWRWDNGGKPAFYSAGNTNLYVAYNPNAQSGSHNYTTSTTEESSLVSAGWKYAQVAWKVEGVGKGIAPVVHKDSLGYTVFTQQDNRWGNLSYAGDPIWDGGCGLVSTTMAIDALTGETLTPADTVKWANANNAVTWNDVGQSVLRIAQAYGLNAGYVAANVSSINQVLRNGGMVSISGSTVPNYANGSPFTGVGHYIVIKKLMSNGNWMIFDSNDQFEGSQLNAPMSANNNKQFSPSLIMQYQHYYAVAMYKK